MFVNSLHGLRGAAAFGVFIAHCAGGYAQNLCDQCQYQHILKLINNVGTFGVEIFFFLSGFVIYLSSLNAGPLLFFKRRFWRIYPVLLFFTVLFAVGNVFLHLEPEKNRLDYFLLNLTFTNLLAGTPALTPNAWTITYEVMFYLFTFAGVYFGLRVKNAGLSLLVAIGAVAFFINHAISMYYVAGVILAALHLRFKLSWETVPASLVHIVEGISVVTILYLSSSEQVYNWAWLAGNPSTFMLVLSVFLLVACLLHPASWTRHLLEFKPVLYLGTISYSLYLAHPYSYLITRKVVEVLNRKGVVSIEYQLVVFAVLVLFATLALSFIVHRLIEIPCYQRMTGKKIVGA